MAKENHSDKLLPFDVIVKASKGDELALCKVLEHYDGYIAKLCTCTFHDEYGNTYSYVDEDMRNILKARLITRTLMFNAI